MKYLLSLLFPLVLQAATPPATSFDSSHFSWQPPLMTMTPDHTWGSQTLTNSLTVSSTNATPTNWIGGITMATNLFYNVQSFGASPLVVADSTVAIQAALDNVPSGSTVFFPPGTYSVGTLSFPAKTLMLYGAPGAVLLQSASAIDALLHTGAVTNVVIIKNLILDGNQQNRAAHANDSVSESSIICATNVYTGLYCENVTFTNSLRAAICTGGSALIDNCQFLAAAQHNLTNDTYHIFAQPFDSTSDFYLTVRDCRFTGVSNADADLYRQAHGIFFTEQSSGTNVYRGVLIINNRFDGIAGMAHSQPGGAIESYNGSERVIITGNQIENYGYSAIKVQRCNNALIANNIAYHGYNDQDGNCFAIAYTPEAREGFSPFTGGRAGETHYNAIITGNIVRDVQRCAFYLYSDATPIADLNVLLANNVIDGVSPSITGSFILPVTINGNNVIAQNNVIRNVQENAFFASSSLTGIQILDNTITWGSTTNTDSIVYLANAIAPTIRGNRFYLSPTNNSTAINLSSITNGVIENNVISSGGISVNIAGASVDCRVRDNVSLNAYVGDYAVDLNTTSGVVSEDNSWNRLQRRLDKNGTFASDFANYYNPGSNHVASALLSLHAAGSGLNVGVYPTNYSDSLIAGRGGLISDTSGSGLFARFYPGQDFKIFQDGTTSPLFYETPIGLFLYATNTTPLIVDAGGSTATYEVFRNGGLNKGYIGYNASQAGMVMLNGAGSQFNWVMADSTGDEIVRGKTTTHQLHSYFDGKTVIAASATSTGPSWIGFEDSGGASERGFLGYVGTSDNTFTINNNLGNGIWLRDVTAGVVIDDSLTVTNSNTGAVVGGFSATSGYTGTGTKFLADDKTYKSIASSSPTATHGILYISSTSSGTEYIGAPGDGTTAAVIAISGTNMDLTLPTAGTYVIDARIPIRMGNSFPCYFYMTNITAGVAVGPTFTENQWGTMQGISVVMKAEVTTSGSNEHIQIFSKTDDPTYSDMAFNGIMWMSYLKTN